MIIAIHQPQYLSWQGFFNKIMNVDLFVILDSVQFQKNGFQNRTRIKATPAWQWLTIPVSFEFPAVIGSVRVCNKTNWQEKHWKSICQNYAKAPFFEDYADKLKIYYERPYANMIDFIIDTNSVIFEALDIKTPVIRSSQMGIDGLKSDLLISICKKTGADRYLAGIGGKEYMEEDKFSDAGIGIIYQEYKHPLYEQQFKDIPFQSNMSVLDVIFNCGKRSREIILAGHQINKGDINNA